VQLAEGWWSGASTFQGANWNYFGDRQSFLAKIVVNYADGTQKIFTTQPDTWQVTDSSPLISANFFQGEKYVSTENFITELVSSKNKKAQIINISLEGLDDTYAKSLVKIFSKIIFDFAKSNTNRATIPFHLFLEEAHRYVQNDGDVFLLGYNIFERIAKEGRKYGVILDIITQRPVEMSDTVVAQCSNFLIFKMTHPKDIGYISEMLPNISQDVIEKMKILQPGTCVAFGTAFKIPMICKMDMPDPRPFSASCNVSAFWDSQNSFSQNLEGNNSTQNIVEISDIEIQDIN